jgi:voltage-gated potassium channel
VTPSPRKRDEQPARGDVPLRSTLTIGDTLRPFAIRFAGALAYFLALFAMAAIGYHNIEGWHWFDSIYMAVTTVSSVGFMEVHPLTPEGRTFTLGVIFLGVTGLGVWWALITALIVELDLGGALRRRKKMKRIENLQDHYVVCGAGRVGRMVTREMRAAQLPLLVIERDETSARRLEEDDPETLVICADATKERVLAEAGVARSRGLAACLADDGDNLLVCLTAREMNPQLSTVARAYDEESMDRLRRAGADHVISPTLTGGIRMASTLLRPHVVSFLDSAILGPEMDLRLEEARIPDGSPLSGRSLEEVRIPQHTGLVIIALQRGGTGGTQVYNPGPDTLLHEGDVMIVLGREGQVQELRRYAETG